MNLSSLFTALSKTLDSQDSPFVGSEAIFLSLGLLWNCKFIYQELLVKLIPLCTKFNSNRKLNYFDQTVSNDWMFNHTDNRMQAEKFSVHKVLKTLHKLICKVFMLSALRELSFNLPPFLHNFVNYFKK